MRNSNFLIIFLPSSFASARFEQLEQGGRKDPIMIAHQSQKSFLQNVILFMTILLLSACRSAPNSEDDASDLAIGTWTSSTPGDLWIKLVITSDGKFTEYDAHPTDQDWGDPDATGTWKIGTNKYSDTGNRHYYIAFSTSSFSVAGMFDAAIFRSGNEIYFSGEGGGYLLTHGDKFPFSN